MRVLASFAVAWLVASCGGGGGAGGSSPPAMPPAPLDIAVSGMAVIKVRSGADGVALLEEKLASLAESGPQRRITLLDSRGALRGRYSAPPGLSVIDFAQHPSGEISVALATSRTVTLVRLDAAAIASGDFPLTDT